MIKSRKIKLLKWLAGISVILLSLIHISGSYAKATESERDTLVCDEYGFAETKDLPYGTYTCLLYTSFGELKIYVHQIL